jgi:hypothetical protein
MIRKFNYTDRTRIERKDVEINLQNEDERLFFTVNLNNLPSYGFPPQSLIFIEAYRQTNWMRFSFGKISSPNPIGDFCLNDFDSAEGILFRIKIIENDKSHKIIGSADAIPFVKPISKLETRESLLPVQPSNELGELIYMLDFREGNPKLLINKYAGDYNVIARSSSFISLVYPEVFRHILTNILINQGDFADDTQEWQKKWVSFAKCHRGVGELNDNYDEDEKNEWINSVIKVFAKNIKCLALFEEHLKEG